MPQHRLQRVEVRADEYVTHKRALYYSPKMMAALTAIRRERKNDRYYLIHSRGGESPQLEHGQVQKPETVDFFKGMCPPQFPSNVYTVGIGTVDPISVASSEKM